VAATVEQLIRQAIAERRVVAYRYDGQRRVGEPHLYGKSGGRAALLVFQTDGSHTAGPYPNWRRCDLDRVTRFTITSRTFSHPRLSPTADHGDWDEVWAIVR
jgi:hypothetical protein